MYDINNQSESRIPSTRNSTSLFPSTDHHHLRIQIRSYDLPPPSSWLGDSFSISKDLFEAFMTVMHQIHEAGKLFIGGIFTLRSRELLEKANITHIISIISQDVKADLVKDYKHLAFNVDDVDYEDILQYFEASNAFIAEGLAAGGGVLVHCMMGKSRSATLVCAYLMHLEPTRTPEDAVEIIKQYRNFVEPNEGFMDQLRLYHKMGCPSAVWKQYLYQRWLFERRLKEHLEAGQAPAEIRFEDEVGPMVPDQSDYKITCRKCRRVLASTAYLIPHEPKEDSATTKALQASEPIAALDNQGAAIQPAASTKCSHLFLDPLSWMREELEQGKLEGRLECPKCKSNVGKYAWQGSRCSCNAWIVPGISLSRSRVDELKNLSGTKAPSGTKI